MLDPIDAFCADYHSFHGISKRRRLEQASTLRRFEEFLSKRGTTIQAATADDLRDHLIERIDGGQSPSGVLKVRNMIRPFYSWSAERGHLPAERAETIQRVPSPQRDKISDLPRPYRRHELDTFYEALDERWPHSTDRVVSRFERKLSKYRAVWRHAMNAEIHAMVGLALYCGLRREEVYRVSLDDIDPINEYVLVQDGKGGLPREVPYPDELRKLVTEWLRWRQRVMLDHGVRHTSMWLSLWPSQGWRGQYGEPHTPAAPMIWRTFETLLKDRVADGFTWHRFRHTCGTEWLRVGMPIEKVQRLLGHSKLSQTQKYLEIVKSDVAREVVRNEAAFVLAVAPRKAA